MEEQQTQEAQVDHIAVLKQSMINTISQHYSAFIEAIKIYPGADLQRTQALIRFDEGRFWLEQAVIHSQFEYRNLDKQNMDGTPKIETDFVPQPDQEQAPSEPVNETASEPVLTPTDEPVVA